MLPCSADRRRAHLHDLVRTGVRVQRSSPGVGVLLVCGEFFRRGAGVGNWSAAAVDHRAFLWRSSLVAKSVCSPRCSIDPNRKGCPTYPAVQGNVAPGEGAGGFLPHRFLDSCGGMLHQFCVCCVPPGENRGRSCALRGQRGSPGVRCQPSVRHPRLLRRRISPVAGRRAILELPGDVYVQLAPDHDRRQLGPSDCAPCNPPWSGDGYLSVGGDDVVFVRGDDGDDESGDGSDRGRGSELRCYGQGAGSERCNGGEARETGADAPAIFRCGC
mmetsp:Transcript_66776/g.178074  ORF Transcript_66776/g.178074 Transcript_66776/m.178074 type:complete len:272 (-) Transcript_66776:554-1369(-)